MLPVLGSDDDVDDLTVDGDVLRLGDRTWPIAPGTGTGSGAEVHDRQHYRLIGWRTTSAATGGSSPSPRWPGCARRTARCSTPPTSRSSGGSPRVWSTGSASTIPTDCPIPQAISRGCASSTGPDAWIVIEKILAVDEALEPTLPVAGTTGYDALREIGGLFVDPTGSRR